MVNDVMGCITADIGYPASWREGGGGVQLHKAALQWIESPGVVWTSLGHNLKPRERFCWQDPVD